MKNACLWQLRLQPSLDNSDLLWIKGLDCEVTVKNNNSPLRDYLTCFINPEKTEFALIVTHSEKQETMLKLKYGDELRLLHRLMFESFKI